MVKEGEGMEIFLFSCNVILPIVLLTLLGYFLKRIKVFDDAFLNKANSIVFKVFIPILLFSNIAFIDKEVFSEMNYKLVIYSVIAIFVLFFIGLLIATLFVKDRRQKGVILQAIFRSNYAIIGIPLCEFLCVDMEPKIKATCIGLATIMAAVSVPIFNTLAVISLSMFDKNSNNKISITKILKKIVTNPLIIGVVSGLIFLGLKFLIMNFGVDLSTSNISNNFLYKAIKNVASIASPFALIVLGGRFKFSSVKKLASKIILGTVLRIVFTPLLTLVVGYLLGFRTTEFPTLIALFATPVAVSSVPMAIEMKQDGELAGQIVVWTSISSILSLFIIILVCSLIGIFPI